MRYTQNCLAVDDGDCIIYTGLCLVTGKLYTVSAPKKGIIAYKMGALIQDAFPSLSDGDREFLLSGFSPEVWNLVFPEEE